ncbi:MAG: glycosyltransferase [Candidatus Omnitrophica bacterium]|nr:glycosyltransferase [Candidatus Omnitrophota bacterium]
MPLTANIIILNYNGKELLPQCLPSIVEAARKSPFPCRVTLLDNQSKDDGLSWAKQNYPEVEIVHSPQNRFLCSYNDYIAADKDDVVILLNNDIKVDAGFIAPLVKPFETDPLLFLVAPRVMDFSGKKVEAGKSRSGIRAGHFWCNARYPGYESELMQASETDSSGFGAFSREKFIALNGYDDLYLPGIMEDVDLCYRAKGAGFHLRYEPQSVVYHIGQASFKKVFGSKKIMTLAHRNTFLFMWKNFKSPGFWVSHVFFLPFRILWSLLKGDDTLFAGLIQALQKKRP